MRKSVKHSGQKRNFSQQTNLVKYIKLKPIKFSIQLTSFDFCMLSPECAVVGLLIIVNFYYRQNSIIKIFY